VLLCAVAGTTKTLKVINKVRSPIDQGNNVIDGRGVDFVRFERQANAAMLASASGAVEDRLYYDPSDFAICTASTGATVKSGGAYRCIKLNVSAFVFLVIVCGAHCDNFVFVPSAVRSHSCDNPFPVLGVVCGMVHGHARGNLFHIIGAVRSFAIRDHFSVCRTVRDLVFGDHFVVLSAVRSLVRRDATTALVSCCPKTVKRLFFPAFSAPLYGLRHSADGQRGPFIYQPHFHGPTGA
jgi:hypothetical protein